MENPADPEMLELLLAEELSPLDEGSPEEVPDLGDDAAALALALTLVRSSPKRSRQQARRCKNTR